MTAQNDPPTNVGSTAGLGPVAAIEMLARSGGLKGPEDAWTMVRGAIAVAIADAVTKEHERCIAACVEVMSAYGGDPAGRLLSSERVRMQHQLQASGAAQCIERIKGPNAEFSGGPAGPSHTTGRP